MENQTDTILDSQAMNDLALIQRVEDKTGVRPTQKQARAATLMAQKPEASAGQILSEAGYSAKIALKPNKVTKSPGFRAVADAVGLTDEFILDALHEDIQKKPQNRKGELELAAKIKGMTSGTEEEKDINVTIGWLGNADTVNMLKPDPDND